MGRDSGNKSSAPRKSGSSLWVGLLVGIVVGVGMAAGVAWYLMKAPNPFTNKEGVAKALPESAKPEATAATSATTEKPGATSSDGKPRFEFYKVLTDKQNASVETPAKTAEIHQPAEKPQAAKSQPTPTKMAAAYEPQVLQAGSFSSVGDAEKLKAKLALLGVEASIQTATIPDKGVWYRVRLGPYKTADELSHASNFLKQNGVDSTPMHAQ